MSAATAPSTSIGSGRSEIWSSEARLRVPVAVRAIVVALAIVPAFVAAHRSWALPAFIAFDIAIAVLAVIDLETLRVPNRILGPAFLVGIALLALAAMASGDWDRLAWAFASAVVMFGFFVGLRALSPHSLGMGDVKLAPYLALHLGWIAPAAVLLGLLVGAFAAAVAGALAISLWKGTWKSALPYAPFLALGALVAQLASPAGA